MHNLGPCDEWTGPFRNGYGVYKTRMYRDRLAHRVAWEEENGPIPDGLDVCHHCDNPPCVRISHLFLGTKQDNQADKVAKGRQAVGENNGRSKLTTQEVAEIRQRYVKGQRPSLRELGLEYGVHLSVIGKIVNHHHRKVA